MTVHRTVAWRRRDVEGVGMVRVTRFGDGYVAEGAETITDGGAPSACRFSVGLDRSWLTRRVQVEVVSSSAIRHVLLQADGAGSWWIDGRRAAALDGCLDVDIAATPFTNTFPIRRLGLDVGQSQDIRAAWIGIPQLQVEAVEQRYTRLDADRYEYLDAAFGRYVLVVDDDGIVVDYERFAERISR